MSAGPFPQAALFGEPQAWQTEIYRQRMAKFFIVANRHVFRPDFMGWLDGNWPIWQAFEREANRIWVAGRRHYSARTIGEYLRHESALRETPNEHGFKVNDHWWPDLARLYMLMYPERDGFFERRVSHATLRAA